MGKIENKLLSSAIEAIGQTPLVELSRVTRELDGRILAKLDHLNPGFSKKDRIARQMIEDARADGRLAPGQTVVELTSGKIAWAEQGLGRSTVLLVDGHLVVLTERGRMLLVEATPAAAPRQLWRSLTLACATKNRNRASGRAAGSLSAPRVARSSSRSRRPRPHLERCWELADGRVVALGVHPR